MSSTSQTTTRSAALRKQLGHPVIDGDGHLIEITPLVVDHLDALGGPQLVDRFLASSLVAEYKGSVLQTDLADRTDRWRSLRSWWHQPAANTLDRATSMLPRLLYERLDELGFDLAVVYGSESNYLLLDRDEELRRLGCRAYNTMNAELFGPYGDRLLPAAVIPMVTPDEAIDELEYAVSTLGLRAVQLPAVVYRHVPAIAREHPGLADLATRPDYFALDSDYDYDPVWAKCVELGVAPTFHSSHMGMGARRSVSNYMFNHIGSIAAANEAICKALFLGGVTRRFPTLRFGFLEGGVGWACSLYSDLVGHWHKRNARAISHLDPERIDADLILDLVDTYGDDAHHGHRRQIEEFVHRRSPRPEHLDEFRFVGAEVERDLAERFVPSFFFGCEADDPMNAWAFDRRVNPMGQRLAAMFSSDIGHWDVPDMREVLEEAWELVEHGLLDAEAFREFTFTNSVRLHAGMNPGFFSGTVLDGTTADTI
jgi:predicted TIM-barrel fold metal-dependent hydrolase